MNEIIMMTLKGGPHDGEKVEIHRENLKIKPRISVKDENNNWTEYALDENGQYVWLSDPNDPRFIGKWHVCDDDGNVISEEPSEEDAMKMLDNLNNVKKHH